MNEQAISKWIRVIGLVLTIGTVLYIIGTYIYGYLLIEEIKSQTYEEYFFVIDIYQLSIALLIILVGLMMFKFNKKITSIFM